MDPNLPKTLNLKPKRNIIIITDLNTKMNKLVKKQIVKDTLLAGGWRPFPTNKFHCNNNKYRSDQNKSCRNLRTCENIPKCRSVHRDIWITHDISLTMRFGRNFMSNIHKKYNNQNKRYSNLRDSISGPEIVHFSSLFSHQTVMRKNTIPRTISAVNMLTSNRLSGYERFEPINGAINRADDILIDNPEKALSQGLVKNSFINVTLQSNIVFVNRITGNLL